MANVSSLRFGTALLLSLMVLCGFDVVTAIPVATAAERPVPLDPPEGFGV